MTLMRTLAAGIAALALLVAPVGLTVQWGEHGPAMTTASVISTAYAAPSRPTAKRPSNGGPTITRAGSASRTTGFQTRAGGISDALCQGYADMMDQAEEQGNIATADGDIEGIVFWDDYREQIESEGMDQGCAFHW